MSEKTMVSGQISWGRVLTDSRIGRVREFRREVRRTQRDRRPLGVRPVVVLIPAGHLVVDPARRGGARTREPVDRDPLEDCSGRNRATSVERVCEGRWMLRTFIVCPGVFVGPGHELLVDPGEEADRRVHEAVPDRLRLGGLFGPVARARLVPLLRLLVVGACLVVEESCDGQCEHLEIVDGIRE